jgi:hypothetical protein
MGVLEDMSVEFVKRTGVRGLDWAKYDAAGFGPGTRQSAIGSMAAPHGYVFVLSGDVLEGMKVITTLDTGNSWTMTREQAEQAIESTGEQVKAAADDVWEAIKDGSLMLAKEKVAKFPGEFLKRTVGAVSLNAYNGYVLHMSGAVADLVQAGRVSEDEAKKHADNVAMVFRAIKTMDVRGDFSGIKYQPKAQSGLGVLPAFIAAYGGWLIVAAVVVILGIAFFVYASLANARAQAKFMDQCEELRKLKGAAGAQYCVDAAKDMAEKSNIDLAKLFSGLGIGGAMKAVGIALGIGVAAYIGVKFIWPEIQKQRARA